MPPSPVPRRASATWRGYGSVHPHGNADVRARGRAGGRPARAASAAEATAAGRRQSSSAAALLGTLVGVGYLPRHLVAFGVGQARGHVDTIHTDRLLVESGRWSRPRPVFEHRTGPSCMKSALLRLPSALPVRTKPDGQGRQPAVARERTTAADDVR